MNPTASELERALNCEGSFALPQYQEPYSVHADRGTGVHDFIVDARLRGREEALAAVPEDAVHRLFAEQLDLEQLPQGGNYELAVAWNSETNAVIVLGENIGRAYRARAVELGIDPEDNRWWFGTLDVFGVADGKVINYDYKTGFYSAGDPEKAPQLLFGSMVGVLLTGAGAALQAFLYLREDGAMHRAQAEVDELELSAFGDRLRALVPRIENARARARSGQSVEVKGGSWCRYCSAKRSCPIQLERARSMGADLVLMRQVTPTEEQRKSHIEITPKEAGTIYLRAVEYRKLAEAIESDMEELARVVPLELEDGYVLKEMPQKLPTKIKADLAEEALKKQWGDELANKMVVTEKTVTMTAIEDALRPIAKPRQLTKMNQETVRELRRAGALIEGSTTRVKKVKATGR